MRISHVYFFSFYGWCSERDSSKLKQEKANAVYIDECDYKLLHFSNDNGSFLIYVDFVFLYHRQYFYRSWLWVAWQISYKKRELLTQREYLGSCPPLPPFFGNFHIACHLSFLCCVFLDFVQCLVPNFTYVS